DQGGDQAVAQVGEGFSGVGGGDHDIARLLLEHGQPMPDDLVVFDHQQHLPGPHRPPSVPSVVPEGLRAALTAAFVGYWITQMRSCPGPRVARGVNANPANEKRKMTSPLSRTGPARLRALSRIVGRLRAGIK